MPNDSMNLNKSYPFSFDPSACQSCGGRCCIGESGYVFISIDEIMDIALFLNLSFESFTKQYIRKVSYKFSLLEKPYNDGLACIFFDTLSKQCSIYDHRPKQCRSYPFWEAHQKLNDSDLALLKQECPGICTLNIESTQATQDKETK